MIRRSRSEWLQIIEEHKHSNLTATEFCKSKGIDPKYFSLKKAKFQHFEAASPFIEALAPEVTGPELSLSWAGQIFTYLPIPRPFGLLSFYVSSSSEAIE